MSHRLTISMTVDPVKHTPDDAIRDITAALNLFGKQNGGTLAPWAEQRREPRGVISHRSIAVGTWRLVQDEPSPRAVADAVIAGLLPTAQVFGLVSRGEPELDVIRDLIAHAIREDRTLAARIAPDDDF